MDSFSIESQQKSSYQHSLNQDQNFKISKNALQVQLNSLKQAQNDFETENRPFLKFEPYDIQIKLQIKNHTIRLNFPPKSPKHDTIHIGLGSVDTIVLSSTFSNLG